MAKTLAPAPVVDSEGFVTGTTVSRGETAGGTLPDFGEDRGWPFYLVHHHNNWELVEHGGQWEFLPLLRRIPIRPGCIMAEQAKNPKEPTRTGRMRAKLEDDGQATLTDTETYTVSIPSIRGTSYHLKWERYRVYPDGDHDPSFDHDGFNAWRRSLVEEGRIGEPRPKVLNRLRQRLQRRLGRIQKDIHLPKAKQQQAEAEAALEALNASQAKPLSCKAKGE